MRCFVVNLDTGESHEEELEPQCVNRGGAGDFCDDCGDCLVCHAEDRCHNSKDGTHSWVRYLDEGE